MRNPILLLIALAACAADPSTQAPDAGVAIAVDAPLDAPPPRKQGDCVVSNMPFDRDFTATDGAPLPPDVINNLQDMFKGDRRTHFTRQVLPACWTGTGTAPTLVPNPQAGGAPLPTWLIPTAQTVHALIPYEPGDTVTNVLVDVYGDGAADVTINIAYESDLSAAPVTVLSFGSTGGAVLNTPAAWTRVDVSDPATGGGVAPETLGDGYLQIIMIVSGGANIHVGNVYLKAYR